MYELKFENKNSPPSRKNAMIRIDGMNPMKMYDRISFRRTRHSKRRLAQAIARTTKYAAAATITIDDSVSIASRIGGGTITRPTAKTAILTTTRMTIARPGKVLNSARFMQQRSRGSSDPRLAWTSRY